MTEGEFKKRFKDAFFELPKDSDRNKVHAFYMQTKGLIAIDEAKKEFLNVLPYNEEYPFEDREIGDNADDLRELAKLIKKWFGDKK
jgi:hypothetical protein